MSNGDLDIYLAKYNPDGELLWIKSEGGTQAERIYGLTQHENLIYATGYMFGNSVFNDEVILSSYGGRDIFISCYNTDGDFYWAENHGSSGDDWAFEILHDKISSIYVTGFHNDNASFGDITLPANQNKNLFTGKFTDENSSVLISENDLKQFKIYPNPSYGILHIDFTEITELKLFDIYGNCVCRIQNPNQNTINLNYINSGSYLLMLKDTIGNQTIQRIIINN